MKSVIVFFWLTIIILITSWFFFMPGMFYLHDYLHTARIGEMARGLADGYFPVRWSENFGFGYGMPLFEFYAPLPFYVGGLLALLGIPTLIATKLVFIICNIGTAIGSYYLGKSLYGRVGGLITAAAITMAPYRAVNLYVRGALSESWGVMAAVWILYFTHKISKGDRTAWIGLTVSLVVLFLSHNLVTMIFIPFSVAVAGICIVFSKKTSSKLLQIVRVLKAYLFAICISSFYLFPAFIEKNLTKVQDSIIGGYFDYSLHFVYLRQFISPNWGYGGSSFGPTDDISFFLGYGQLLAVVASGIVALGAGYNYLHNRLNKKISAKWWLFCLFSVLFIVSILLATDKSLFIWKAMNVLQFVQFPWRFLSVSLVLLGLIVPFFLFAYTGFVKRWFAGWLVLLVIIVSNIYFFHPSSQQVDVSKLYSSDEAQIRSELSKTLPDYIPIDAPEEEYPPVSLVQCDECATLNITKDKVHQKVVTASVSEPSTLLFSIHYFPGWVATVNNNLVETKVENGLLAVDVPAGTSEVSVEFGSTQLRSVTDMVSLVSGILFICLAAYSYKTRKFYETRS